MKQDSEIGLLEYFEFDCLTYPLINKEEINKDQQVHSATDESYSDGKFLGKFGRFALSIRY